VSTGIWTPARRTLPLDYLHLTDVSPDERYAILGWFCGVGVLGSE